MSKKKKIILTVCAALLVAAAVVVTVVLVGRYRERKHREDLTARYHAAYAELLIRFEEENKTAEDIDVVFLGDSLTAGYDLEKYYPEYKTLNRGIGGDTTDGLKGRLQTSVFEVRPKVAVMLIGANNFDTMMNDYESILQLFGENIPETKIVLLSLTAMTGKWGHNNGKAIENNKQIKALAKEYGYEFVDLFTPLCDEKTGEAREGYTVDGGHLTPEGYEVVTAQIKPVLAALLDKE